MGAAFAPPLILSLHWKRTTGRGVLCGMLAGVAVSVIWYNVPFLKAQLYEILPAAAASALATVAVRPRGRTAARITARRASASKRHTDAARPSLALCFSHKKSGPRLRAG